jgi:hypothetical protein
VAIHKKSGPGEALCTDTPGELEFIRTINISYLTQRLLEPKLPGPCDERQLE